MKVSYRTYPILSFLDKGVGLSDIKIYKEDEEHLHLRTSHYGGYIKTLELFNKKRDAFKKDVKILSTNFGEAYESNISKMVSGDLIHQTCFTSGTLILCTISWCYDFTGNQITLFIFQNDILIFLLKSGENENERISFFSEHKYKRDFIFYKQEYTYKKVLPNAIVGFIALQNFIKYAPIETKYLQATQKVKGFNCKYVNDTNINIQILDSGWYTNLVKSDAFNVRGHWRLQPYGQGLKDRKLIWIKDFEKHGYTRQAGKLKDEAAS